MKAKVGDVVKFGNYHGEVEWDVVAKTGSKALLVSKYGVDTKCYDSNYKFATWETCELRKWLNKEFINQTFTQEEKTTIIMTDVPADDNPDYRVGLGSDTKDRVFLLSIPEVKKYLKKKEVRECQPTEYAKSQGLCVEYGGKSWWWLRTPGYTDYFASFVHSDGAVDTYGYAAIVGRSVVRPAMWVQVEA